MGISLYGLTPATTYDALIKTGDNEPLTASLKVLSDGVGTNLPMEASTTGINFTGTLLQSGVAVPTASQVAAKQDTLVSGTNIKTVNSTSLLGSGNVAVQDVLVSGTNIKTINGTSVLGSGNIVTPSTPPSGVAGAIQFSNGSAFASDATNFFWDNTNKRLGIGTNAPLSPLNIVSGNGASDGSQGLTLGSGSNIFRVGNYFNIGILNAPNGPIYAITNQFGIGTSYANAGAVSASLFVRGSGSTSATTSLLVQNSAGTQLLQVRDDGVATFNSTVFASSFAGSLRAAFINSDGNAFTVMRTNNSTGNATFDQFVAIGTTSAPVASAALEVVSTTKGFLPPRMTTTQKNAIATPAAGLVVYDNTTNKLQCYNGSTWNDLF